MLLSLYKQKQLRKHGIAEKKATKFETVDDRIVLYRFLGHFEILSAHVWKINNSWWIWDKWKYTCIITNAATIEGSFKNSDQIESEYFHQRIINNNKPEDMEICEDKFAPKITGSFNNWKCTSMMKIDKFYDWLLRNNLPVERTYVKDEPILNTKISKILNQEIYTTFRNQMWFVAHTKPTIMDKLLEERKKLGVKGKRHKERVVLDIEDMHK
jgi:hypothetical protein